MSRPASIASLLVLGAVLAACGGSGEGVLAEVGDRVVTQDQFREAYVDYLLSTGLPDQPGRRSSFLERLVSMELVRLDALEHGLGEGDAWRDAEERARRRLLLDAWITEVAFDTLTVDEAELEDLFVRVNTEITARHLYAPTREEAERLAERLAAGETFEDLAREVFADPVLAASGGSLGTFGFDEMDPAFEEVAFTLAPGSVSGPVRTSQGWSILRVDDRFTRPLLTETEFAARMPQLRAYVLEREQKLARRGVLEEMLISTAPEIEPSVADRVLGLLGPAVVGAEDVNADAVLIRYTDDGESRAWTVGEFLAAARYTDLEQRRAVRDRSTFEAFATGLLVRDVIMERARRAGLDRTARFRQALDSAMDEWLYERGYERIAAAEPVPEDTLRAFFERHAAELVLPERVAVREIVTTGRAEADSIRAALSGAPFDELARRHSVRSASSGAGGDLGPLSRADLGPLADRVFAAPRGAVIGPIPVPGQFLLLEVGERSEARPATFDEAREQIEAIVRREQRDRLVRERAALLRDRFAIRYADVDLAALPLRSEPVVSS